MFVRALRFRLALSSLAVVAAIAPAAAVSAQTVPAAFAPFSAAMQRGDASALRAVLAERVMVSLDGNSRVYSREQAVHVFERFFRDRPAGGFTLDYPREAGGDALFAAGRYRTEDETYVVRVLLNLRGGRYEAQEVRIDQGRLE